MSLKLPPEEKRRREKARQVAYQANNREAINANHRRWVQENKDKCKQYAKRFRDENKEKCREWNRVKRIKSRLKQNAYAREWRARRSKENPEFRLIASMRQRIRHALLASKTEKCGETKSLLGCSPDFLRGYLEGKFEIGMAWENYGRLWVVDHIIPCAFFDLTTIEDQRECFNYTNLQPLWKLANIIKSDRLPSGMSARILK